MRETEKYYPCGAMRPEYVEELIDNLILPDKERLIEKLARGNGFVYPYETEFPDAEECVERIGAKELLNTIDKDEIEDYIEDTWIISDWLEHVDVDEAIEYYGANDILANIDDDIIHRYLND